MKEYFEKLVIEFKRFNMQQKIAAAILALSIPLCLGMGISAVSGYSSEDENTPSSSLPQSSTVVSSTPQSSSQSSSASQKLKEVFLIPASIEEDLEVQVVDEDGELVLGPVFTLHVKCASNGYSKKWQVEGDGFLRLPTIPSGTYTVTIEEMEGYIVPEEPVTVKVEKKVEYEKLDVSDKVVDESKIDVSKEDAAYDDAQTQPQATPAPELKDTVKYVKSSSKKVKKDVEVITYKYKAVTLEDGTIKTKDGKSSGLFPVTDSDGYVTGAYKLEYPSQPQSEATVSAQSELFSLMTFTLDTDNSQIQTADNEEQEGQATPAPTPEATPQPTVEPTPQPTPEPTVEPTPTAEPVVKPTPPPAVPTETPAATPTPTPTPAPSPSPTVRPTPSATPTATPTPTPRASPSPSVSPSPTVTPSPSQTPAVSPSPSVSPTPTASPSPSPSPSKKDVTIFGEDGKPLADLNLMLTEYEFKSTEKQEVTVYYGWQTLDGNRYYFDKDGVKVTGTQVIQGVTYHFDKTGIMGSRIGIDVSKYQRDIDWKAVKKSGVEFAIIRAGYRGYGSGALVEDPYFEKNIKNATAAGIKVGVYIFSQAISTKEAVEEASMCLDAVKGHKITYPIFFDTEYSTSRKTGRADSLTKSQRTKIAKAFCETIQNSGYQAGVYASASWFSYQLEYSDISKYDIWVAHYGVDKPAMGTKHYDIWQYTGTGTCAGVPGAVDMNIGYTAY